MSIVTPEAFKSYAIQDIEYDLKKRNILVARSDRVLDAGDDQELIRKGEKFYYQYVWEWYFNGRHGKHSDSHGSFANKAFGYIDRGEHPDNEWIDSLVTNPYSSSYIRDVGVYFRLSPKQLALVQARLSVTQRVTDETLYPNILPKILNRQRYLWEERGDEIISEAQRIYNERGEGMLDFLYNQPDLPAISVPIWKDKPQANK